MAEIGVALASEDWGPRELVELARSAEEAGFEYAFISDHYHPWVDAQGRARSSGACSAASPRRPRT